MAKSDVQRKLTAILCTDVVGYSRLMGLDESSTLRTLTEYRQVFSNPIEKSLMAREWRNFMSHT